MNRYGLINKLLQVGSCIDFNVPTTAQVHLRRTTHSKFFYTSLKHKSLNQKSVEFTVTTAKISQSICQCTRFGTHLYSIDIHHRKLLEPDCEPCDLFSSACPHGKLCELKLCS